MKKSRQEKILAIIQEQDIGTQDGLAEALHEAGFRVTQATVSRDIKELGLVKVPGQSGFSRYAVPPVHYRSGDRLKRLFRDAVVAMDCSENLIVIKTQPGEAQGVASAVDQSQWPEVIGTVAGDDTILVVVKPTKAVHGVLKRFISLSGR